VHQQGRYAQRHGEAATRAGKQRAIGVEEIDSRLPGRPAGVLLALVAKCRRESPKWDLVDCQYWALSKKQYHGAYADQARQAMSGSMRTGDSLAKIPVPMLILKADASPEARKAHAEAASVMQKGKLVHIDGAGHNLHHDQLARTVELLKEFLSAL
jgi:pimeloyl-ACP methyl ester carboxylesterase